MPAPSPICLLLLLSLGALAAPKPPPMRPQLETFQFQTAEQCFPSGLHVVYQSDTSVPFLEIQTLVEGGSARDPLGGEGEAHLLEHLWFRSRHGASSSVGALLEDLGAWYNGYTYADRTRFVTLVPVEHARTALRLEALRLEAPLAGLQDPDLEVERRVLQQERRSGELSRAVDARLRQALYPDGHPYARADESDASLARLSLEQLRGLAGRAWRPDQTTMTLVGGLSIDQMSQLVDQTFSAGLLAGADPAARPSCATRPVKLAEPAPPAHAGLIGQIPGDVALPELHVAWALPAADGADAVRLDLLAGVTSSWIAYRQQITPGASPPAGYQPSCAVEDGRQGAQLSCQWPLSEGQDPQAALDVAIKHLDLQWGSAYRSSLAREVDYASRALAADTIGSLDLGEGGRAWRLADAAHGDGRLAVVGERMDAISKLDGDTFAAWASRYLSADRAVALVVRPTGASRTDEGTSSLDGLRAAWSPEAEEAPVNAADLALSAAATGLDLSRLREARLDNGLRVVVLPFGEAPLARTWLYFGGGEGTEPTPHLDALTWSALDRFPEAATVGDFDLAREPYKILSRWEIGSWGQGHVVGLRGASGNVEQHLYLLSWMARHMEPSAARRRDALRDLGARLELARHDASAAELAAARQAVLFGHPVQRASATFTTGDLERGGSAMVADWTRRIYQPRNATLLVVGRVDPDAVLAAARSWFSDWTPPAAPAPAAPARPTPAARSVTVLDAPGAQARVTLRCQASPASSTSAEARALVARSWALIAEHDLRAAQGLTYGVEGADLTYAGGVTLLRLQSEVDLSAVGLASRIFLDLPRMTRERSLPVEAVERARRGLAGEALMERSTGLGAMGLLLGPVSQGQDWSALSGHAARLAAADAAALSAQVADCVGHEALTISGPAEVIHPALRAAGLLP